MACHAGEENRFNVRVSGSVAYKSYTEPVSQGNTIRGIVMLKAACVGVSSVRYELRFDSLFNAGRAYAFPCGAEGRVDMDALSETARRNYMYARAVIDRELRMPEVLVVDAQPG